MDPPARSGFTRQRRPLSHDKAGQEWKVVNNGTQLERLVREIEAHLLPEGFSVVPREHVYDDEGHQIAEFDIRISGRLGSSSVNWLIECRDRPSGGPASTAWIEQLAGRKLRFRFDKVFAVSTSGFAPGARPLAEQFGITLRTVESIADIAADYQIERFDRFERTIGLTGPVHINTANPYDRRDVVTTSGFSVKRPDESEYRPLEGYIMEHVDARLELNLLTEDDANEEVIRRGTFVEHTPLDLQVSGEHFRITRLLVPYEVSTRLFRGKILTVRVYSEDNRIIGKEACVEFDTHAGSKQMRLQTTAVGEPHEQWHFYIDPEEDAGNFKRLGGSIYAR